MALQPRYPLRSRRLSLRPLTERDVDALVEYRSQPDACRYVPFEPMDAVTVLNRVRGPWASTSFDKEGQAVTLGAALTDTGELVGDVMLEWTSAAHSSGAIGYIFDPRRSGNGYATEAAHRTLHLAFDDLGLHRVLARIVAGNLASARLAQRIGMRQEAHLVENEWFKGRWIDELVFAILEQEWRAQHIGGCPFAIES